jgi:putative transposase
MARPLRLQCAGGIYHVMARGNNRKPIFHDDRDYKSMLAILRDAAHNYAWAFYAYCLMPNHYHLVLETRDGNLSEGMRQINGVYAMRFHKHHASVGHVFQGRFNSILIDREPYLLQVCRYVVLNPVRADLVSKCEDWPWSSYLETLGERPKPKFLDSEWLLSQFSRGLEKARKAYADFIAGGMKASPPWHHLKAGIFLGDERFVCKFTNQIRAKRQVAEIPRAQRFAERPPLKEVLSSTNNSALRERQIADANILWGYSIKEIARYLAVHRSVVSRILSRHL